MPRTAPVPCWETAVIEHTKRTRRVLSIEVEPLPRRLCRFMGTPPRKDVLSCVFGNLVRMQKHLNCNEISQKPNRLISAFHLCQPTLGREKIFRTIDSD